MLFIYLGDEVQEDAIVKKGLIVTISVMLILAIGGYGAFNYLTKKDVEPAAIGVADDFFEFDNLIVGLDAPSSLPHDNHDIIAFDSQSQQVQPALGGKDSSIFSSDPTHSDDSNPFTTSAEEKNIPITEEHIRQKYEPVFLSLQETALVRLDTLVQRAYAEYQASQAGTNSHSLVNISSRYMSAGHKLEDKVDNAFYALLAQMKKELQDAQLSTHAVREIEGHYREAIQSKKDEIMDKAYAYIK